MQYTMRVSDARYMRVGTYSQQNIYLTTYMIDRYDIHYWSQRHLGLSVGLLPQPR